MALFGRDSGGEGGGRAKNVQTEQGGGAGVITHIVPIGGHWFLILKHLLLLDLRINLVGRCPNFRLGCSKSDIYFGIHAIHSAKRRN